MEWLSSWVDERMEMTRAGAEREHKEHEERSKVSGFGFRISGLGLDEERSKVLFNKCKAFATVSV